MEHAEKTDFPWLMSNVIDNETGRPLAEGKVSHVVDWWGRKIGLVSFLVNTDSTKEKNVQKHGAIEKSRNIINHIILFFFLQLGR